MPAQKSLSSTALRTSIASLPPSGIASRALMARLMIEASSSTGSTSEKGAKGIDPNVLSERLDQEVRGLRDHLVGVDRLRIKRLPAGKGKQAGKRARHRSGHY
jgi:hypothetical protein